MYNTEVSAWKKIPNAVYTRELGKRSSKHYRYFFKSVNRYHKEFFLSLKEKQEMISLYMYIAITL